jgi:hypothetical protein
VRSFSARTNWHESSVKALRPLHLVTGSHVCFYQQQTFTILFLVGECHKETNGTAAKSLKANMNQRSILTAKFDAGCEDRHRNVPYARFQCRRWD